MNLDNPLYKVVTINEATKLWNKEASTLRRAMHNRFEERERRKSGKDWIILVEAMIRVYGPPIKPIGEESENIDE